MNVLLLKKKALNQGLVLGNWKDVNKDFRSTRKSRIFEYDT